MSWTLRLSEPMVLAGSMCPRKASKGCSILLNFGTRPIRDLFLERDEVVRVGLQMANETKQTEAEQSRLLGQYLSGFSVQKGDSNPDIRRWRI